MEIKIPWCGCPTGYWQYSACSTLYLPSLKPLMFRGVPRKGDAFNDLHLTRLEINILVNISHSMWNNRSSSDVTFLVGELVRDAYFQGSPWTPEGISGCRVSVDPPGGGKGGKEAWASPLDTLQERKEFQPTSNLVLGTSLCLAF